MQYTNNNQDGKAFGKDANGKRSFGKSPPPNGMAIENQFARNGATIPYDQQPLINRNHSENGIPLKASYLHSNNSAAVTTLHPGSQTDACSFTSGL